MTVEISNLFTRNRFSSGPSLLFLILYAPVGICLLVLRVFISLQLCFATLVLPTGTLIRKVVLRVLYSAMGIIIQEKNGDKKDDKCKLLISNHITPFDHLAISIAYPCVSVDGYNLPSPLSLFHCYENLSASQSRESLRSNIRAYLNKPNTLPLLLHPEGGTTSGQVALMKYSSWSMDIEKSVLALGLKVRRIPLLHVAPSVLGASWLADLFYLLFSPVTIYSIRYIGKLTKEDSESSEEFADRAQRATAAALNLHASNHSLSDKVEYIKRVNREEAMSSNLYFNPEVHVMALQVKEVLPYLPLDIIKRDLVRTRNVDMTITNFLEGNIPEPVPAFAAAAEESDHAAPSSSPSASPGGGGVSVSVVHTPHVGGGGDAGTREIVSDDLNMAAKTFGKSATERMQSFDERKRNLIEKARRKYLHKCGERC